MASLNRIMLIGGVGKEPETRQFQDGGQVCNFILATSESYTDRSGERKEDTTWHNIVLNGKLANLAQYIHKSSKLYVEGKLRNRSYTTQSGEQRFITEVIALGVQLLDPKPQAQQQAPAPQYQQPAPPPAAPGYAQPPMPPQPQYSQPPVPPQPQYNPPYPPQGADDLPF